MTPSKILFFFSLSFILGVFLRSFIFISLYFNFGLLVLGIILIFLSFFKFFNKNFFLKENFQKKILVTGFCIFFIVLGITRLNVSYSLAESDQLRKFNDYPEEIIIFGKIIKDPDIRENFQKLVIKTEKIIVNGNQIIINSYLLINTRLDKEYQYLDLIKLTGKIKAPVKLKTFNYEDYLIKEKIYSVMDFPLIEIISNEKKNFPSAVFKNIIFSLKKFLRSSIDNQFSPPGNFIVTGLILGNDSAMPQSLKEKLNVVGLSHLTAISGSNVVILSSILTAFLLYIGFWRRQALFISIIFVWFYITVAGFPASGVRAAIMATIFLSAQILGRQNTSYRAIIFAAALMLLKNPLLLRYDIAFQLSFLASAGIITLKPFLDFLLAYFPAKNFNFFLEIFSITIVAQIFTAPVIIYHFHHFSWVAPLTNLLIIPIVNWIIILGFAAALISPFSPLIGFIISLPVEFLLFYFLKIADIFYFSRSSIFIDDLPWTGVIVLYILLIIFIKIFKKYKNPNFLKY